MSWTQDRTTYKRQIQDPATHEVAEIVLVPISWGTTTQLNEIHIGEGGGRVSPGENKLIMCEAALISWTIPIGQPTREVLQQLNPMIGEQIFYYVDIGEGAPPQRELKDADGNVVVEGQGPESGHANGGNGAVPLASSEGAAVGS